MKSRSAPNYTVSPGWNALLPPRVPQVGTPQSKRYDAIVVGAGYTGLAIARRYAELQPNKQVLVIEASEMGEGLSGRNSGIFAPTVFQPTANAYGSAEDDSDRKSRIVFAGLAWLRDVVRANRIDCDWTEATPRIVAAATERGEASVRKSLPKLTKRGIGFKEHEGDELARLIGTTYYRYACETSIQAMAQPAALIRGLADTLPANVTLLEHTTVDAIEGGAPFRVSTERGKFVADKVFVANNAHARTLGVSLNRMVVVHTYAAMTPQLDDSELARLGELPEFAILPPTAMGTTLRKWNRRFLVRSGHSYEREASMDKMRSVLSKLYRRRFPHMKSHDFEYVWGGGVGITSNRESYFGELRPGLFVSAGCQGAGVLRGTIHGKLLAELAAGIQSPVLADRLKVSGPKWIPPEPFRGIGAIAHMAIGDLKAGREY